MSNDAMIEALGRAFGALTAAAELANDRGFAKVAYAAMRQPEAKFVFALRHYNSVTSGRMPTGTVSCGACAWQSIQSIVELPEAMQITWSLRR